MSKDTKTITADAVSYLARNGGALNGTTQGIIRGLVDRLRELDGVPQPKKTSAQRQKFDDWFGPNSNDVFGMGVSLEQFMAVGYAERFQRSWKQQHPKERKRRLGYVMELSAEYERVCAVSIFGTAFTEMAIEAIIEGDPQQLKTSYSMMAEPEYRASDYELWKRTIELTEAAMASWPEDGREEPKETNN